MENITQKELKELLNYNKDTGIFTYLKNHKNKRDRIGTEAGYSHNQGYKEICISQKKYLLHRLAWFYTYGYFPKFVDHINHIRDDNRIGNLREATREQNQKNMSLNRNNKSGVSGVSFCNTYKVWKAAIYKNNKPIYLGNFKEKEDAIKARKDGELKYNYHPNHGT